jgi:hypothetical protein
MFNIILRYIFYDIYCHSWKPGRECNDDIITTKGYRTREMVEKFGWYILENEDTQLNCMNLKNDMRRSCVQARPKKSFGFFKNGIARRMILVRSGHRVPTPPPSFTCGKASGNH